MAERCCMGRDSSCVVNGLQQSTGKFVDEPCYCDEGCLDTGDCCSDYKQICDVQGKTFFLISQVSPIELSFGAKNSAKRI